MALFNGYIIIATLASQAALINAQSSPGDLSTAPPALAAEPSTSLVAEPRASLATEALEPNRRSLKDEKSKKPPADTKEILQAKVRKYQAMLLAERAELESKTSEVKNLAERVDFQSHVISDMRKELEAEKLHTASSSEEITTLKDQVIKIKDKTWQLETRISNLTRHRSSLQGEITKLKEEGTSRAAQLLMASQAKSKLLERNITKLKEEGASLAAQLQTVSQLNSKLLKDLQVQTGKGAKLEVALKSQKAKSSTLEVELQSQKATTSAVEAKVRSQKDIVGAKQTELDAMKYELAQRQKAYQVLQNKFIDLQLKYADPSVQEFLKAKAVKVFHDPGMEGARNKTYQYVIPKLRERYGLGKKMLRDSHVAVYSKLNAYTGSEEVQPWLAATSGYLVYGTVIIPFIFTLCCLTRIVCKLRLLLVFCHLDFLLTTLSAVIFGLGTGREPLVTFAENDAAVFLFTQAVYGVVFCLYAIMLLITCCCSCWKPSGPRECRYRCLQLAVLGPIGYIYYRHIFTPAMLDELPHMSDLFSPGAGKGDRLPRYAAWLPYLPFLALFLLLLYLEHLSWRVAGAAAGAKDEESISITLRNDVDLGSLTPASTDAETYGKKQ